MLSKLHIPPVKMFHMFMFLVFSCITDSVSCRVKYVRVSNASSNMSKIVYSNFKSENVFTGWIKPDGFHSRILSLTWITYDYVENYLLPEA